MHCSKTKISFVSVLSRLILILALMPLCLFFPAASTAFPLAENFEGETTAFDIPADSGWGVVKTHGPWTTFRGSRHLDNNVSGAEQQKEHNAERVIRAITTDWITIPEDSTNPTLSFWYKAELYHHDKIYLDIHYIEHKDKDKGKGKDKGEKELKEKTHTLEQYEQKQNTAEFYVWEKISLKKYKGDEVRVAFRQKIDEDGPGRVFVVDDLRVSDLPQEDADDDGIPDEYDPTPNGELLPPVADLQAINETLQQAVSLEWTGLENAPLLAGYRIYRRKDDETKEVVLNKKQLVPADQNSYLDTEVQNVEGYHYRVVAVSKEGKEGDESSTGSTFAFVAYNLTQYPYEESFDSVDPIIVTPEGSGWEVAEDHGDWSSFSGNYHLDSNPSEVQQQNVKNADQIVRAAMKKRVHIPEDAVNPTLSYWYRLKLTHDHDEIQLDLHYIEDKKSGDEKEKIKKDFRKFKSSDNTDPFKWESISLEKYKGTEIWLVFRQKIDKDGTVGVFILDDLRISQPSGNDENQNGIPDEYESPLNAHMLPYVKNFAATAATDKGEVQLSWSPIDNPKSLVIAGYNVYRSRCGSETPPEKVNAEPLGPEASAFADTTVENDAGYYYHVTGLSGAGHDGYPNRPLPAYVAYNDIPVEHAAATWDQGVARLNWDAVEGVRYRLYRGPAEMDTPELTETAAVPFTDTTAEYYYTYYYRFATVKDFTDPFTDLVVQREGPISPALALTALPPPRAPISGAGLTPEGNYTMRVGDAATYSVSGTYEVMSGPVKVTAVKGDETVVGSGDNGAFDIQLTSAGQWQITIEEIDGWMSTTTAIDLSVDDTPPELTVHSLSERETSDDFIVITGVAADTGSGLNAVVVTSDRYAGQFFGAVLDSYGGFACEVPLGIGANLLTVAALDVVGNQTSANITVTLQLTALPVLSITSPAAGATVVEDEISLTGEVRSSLPPEQIWLVLGERALFPTGADGSYQFIFPDVRLVEGPQTLEVQAETIYGSVSAQVTVTYVVDQPVLQDVLPTIEIQSPLPGKMITKNFVVVTGIAASELGIQQVLVNGQAAQIVGSGSSVSFESLLQFPADGQDELQITAEAFDNKGKRGSVSFAVQYDAEPPLVVVTTLGLQPAPAVNLVTDTPYLISGTVTEKNLAGVDINGQSISVLPAANDDTYGFEASLVLARGEQQQITIEAWDLAANRTSWDLILKLDTALDIEVISPRDGAELLANGETLDVAATVRVPGIAADDQVRVQIDAADATTLSLAGSTANGTIAISAADGEHRMAVEIVSTAGTVLARRTSRFTVVNTANIALAIERQEPANGATGVEPNEFVAVYFNKPVNPGQLQIQVLETVHGLIYDTLEKGADITRLSQVELVDVHRDREPVPGGISHFPGNTMAAFYPQRDFGYGATVYVDVLVNNQALARTSFTVRPLPTFIQGFVADQFMQPISGISIEIPQLGRTAATDGNGSYGFGFGDKAQETIPSGRYRGVINPDLKNRTFGTVERWINAEGGRLNSVGMTLLPILNPDEPFRHIASSQQAAAVLVGGDLTLGLADAALAFPDGRDQGDVHVQFMKLAQIAYPALPSATPNWAFAVQPMGVEVSGPVALTFAMPPLYGSHDYAAHIGARVVLVGYDPAALQLVPVGVGLVDADNHKVSSEGTVTLERLDYLGYALVDTEDQAVLERFANGEISLRQMIGELEGQ